KVHNFSKLTANGIQVKLGVYNYGNSPQMYELARVPITRLDPGKDTTVTCNWVPQTAPSDPAEIHACLKAELIYVGDTFLPNDFAQHNVNIAKAPPPGSTPSAALSRGGIAALGVPGLARADNALPPNATPALLRMQVVNPTDRVLTMHLAPVSSDL